MFGSIAESTRTPNPPGALYFVIIPGQGVNFSGSSALMRHSRLCPLSLMSCCLNESGLAVGEPDLLLDEIDAGHHFGDRMFHLDAGVHFHEEEVVVLVEQKFDRADIPVVHGFDGFDGDAADFPAEFLIDGGRRRFFHEASDGGVGSSNRARPRCTTWPAMDRRQSALRYGEARENIVRDSTASLPNVDFASACAA